MKSILDRRLLVLIVAPILLLIIICNSCSSLDIFEVSFAEVQDLHSKHHQKKYDTLVDKTTLYLDHSTCIIQAVENSKVWEEVKSIFPEYSDTLVLIKGPDYRDREIIPLSRGSSNTIEATLKRITKDIPYSAIVDAINEIVANNHQAILVSDFEAFDSGTGLDRTRNRDDQAYLSKPLESWLAKGFTLYIISEIYFEKGLPLPKKRFYFIFTDDKINTRISETIKSQMYHLVDNENIYWFKLTNSDIHVQSPSNDISDDDLDYTVNAGLGFDFVSIESSWDDIREYVMKLDEFDEAYPDEEKEPFIRDIQLHQGETYKVERVKVIATNITADFIMNSENIEGTDISDAFIVDETAYKNNNIINVYLTDKIFTDGYLTDEYGGNLIRLDFIIDQVSLRPYDESDIFEWHSIYKDRSATCISESIQFALQNNTVVPSGPMHRLLHTVYIKTGEY